jgi:hypothetical protein
MFVSWKGNTWGLILILCTFYCRCWLHHVLEKDWWNVQRTKHNGMKEHKMSAMTLWHRTICFIIVCRQNIWMLQGKNVLQFCRSNQVCWSLLTQTMGSGGGCYIWKNVYTFSIFSKQFFWEKKPSQNLSPRIFDCVFVACETSMYHHFVSWFATLYLSCAFFADLSNV